MKEDKCCCSGGVTTILACPGGSNVGQITNEVAKRLDMTGVGKSSVSLELEGASAEWLILLRGVIQYR